MRHLGHLLRTDARRFRVLLAVWVLLQIADTVFRAVRPAVALDLRLTMALDLLATVLFLSRWLGMIVIVALVVQTHALVGSDAFWMTRPIPWRALLASKIVLLGATFVLVPCLCDVGLMLASRVPVSEIPPVALQTALFQWLWLFLFMALSAITRSLARLALLGGGLLVALVLLLNVTIAVLFRNFPDGPQMTSVTARTIESPAAGIVMLLLLVLSAIALVTVQYRSRSVPASVAAGAIGIGITILVVLMWQPPVRWLPPPSWATTESALQIVSDSAQGEFRPLDDGSPWNTSGAWRMGSLPLRLHGVEEGWLPSVKLEQGAVAFSDGTTLTTVGNGYSSPVRLAQSEDAPHDDVVRRVLGVTRLLQRSPDAIGGTSSAVLVLTQADFERYQQASGTYRGRFMIDLDRVVIASTLPLQAGAVFQGPRDRIRIDQIIDHGRSATIRLRQYSSASMFDADSPPRVAFYLRNRAAAEAVAGSPRAEMGGARGVALPLVVGASYSASSGTGFQITAGLLRFPGGYPANEEPVELSPGWLAQAELVILHTISGGSVPRNLEVAGFQLTPAPANRVAR